MSVVKLDTQLRDAASADASGLSSRLDFDGCLAHLSALAADRNWTIHATAGLVDCTTDAAMSDQPRGLWIRHGADRVLVCRGRDWPEFRTKGAEAVLALCESLEEQPPAGDSALRVRRLRLPCEHENLDAQVEVLFATAALARVRHTRDHLLQVSLALNAQTDPEKVLATMLAEARHITGADAGSIYIVESAGEGTEEVLRFTCAQNDSVDLDFRSFELAIDDSSVAGNCALTGQCLRIDDARLLAPDRAGVRADCNRRHDSRFDKNSGYSTVSMLTVPMRAPSGQVVGVLQLINAKHGREPLTTESDLELRVHPFDDSAEEVCLAVAAQGAVGLENARLFQELEASFRGFVEASVTAIERRDPTTSGHSRRVAHESIELAKRVDGMRHPQLGDISLSRAELEELEYAALLHDFGKVGVPDAVLVKAKKLHPNRLDLLQERVRHLHTAVATGAALWSEREGELSGARAHEFLVAAWRTIVSANEPTVLEEATSSMLPELLTVRCDGPRGQAISLLDNPDVSALQIKRGSLTTEERRAIQDHVVHTRDFLEKIPWRRNLCRVPSIASKHHEYLDGSGYPDGIAADEIPVQARVMTICDIYDALTAADRPYKKAMPLDRAFSILESEAKAGKIDSRLLDVFIASKRPG